MVPLDDERPALPASLPTALGRLAQQADGRAWLTRLPGLIERARERWGLQLAAPFTAGSAAWTCLARPEGDLQWSLVLKIAFPHDEAANEADALLHWQSHGAPVLVDHDAEDWALLMHALVPGMPLSASSLSSERALRAGARVLADLHAAPPPAQGEFPHFEDTLTRWRTLVADRASQHAWAPNDEELVVRWPGVVDDLLATPHRTTLLHGDANPGNILSAEEEHRLRWYAIDPKAVVGDVAFDPWPLLEQVSPDPFAAADVAGTLLGRCAVVAPLLGTTPRAIAGWSFVRRLESTLWLTDLIPDADRHPRSEGWSDLERQWRETRAWLAAYELA